MELNIAKPGKPSKSLSVSDIAFAKEYNEGLIHQVVTAYLAGARQGSRAQKNRAAVRGGGKKPWRQKGTGRARAGTIRSPIWRGGGVTFAAKPKDFSNKINRKMYRAAMRSIFSELARQERLIVVEEINIDSPKTKLLVEKLGQYNLTDVLIVSEEIDENLYLASRNLYKVDVSDLQTLDPVSLIAHDNVMMTVGAVKKFEELLS